MVGGREGWEDGGDGVCDYICYSFWVRLFKDIFFVLLLLLLLLFCLFVIQIATLLGWIRRVSSTPHSLGFPSWVVETFRLFKSVDGPRVTLVPCSAWQHRSQSWGLSGAGWPHGLPGTASPNDQPLFPQNG